MEVWCGATYMVNLFVFRATLPTEMKASSNPTESNP